MRAAIYTHQTVPPTLTLNRDELGVNPSSLTGEVALRILQVNLSGKARTETLNGREYLVVSARLIVPGVLHGSKGALYYPPEEVVRNHEDWNGMPLTMRHPILNGNPVSARSPSVLASQGLGFVFNSSILLDNVLSGEAWFDVENTTRLDKSLPFDQQVLPRLRSGKSVELSTGLFTQDSKAPDGATHNGTPYTYIARNYRPDHLAVLPDEKGACSVVDGCGINVNASTDSNASSEDKEAAGIMIRAFRYLFGQSKTDTVPAINSDPSSTQDTDMVTRAQNVQYLTKNCDCWKGKDAVLNDAKTFTDAEVEKLKTNAELVINSSKQTANAQKRYQMLKMGRKLLANSYLLTANADVAEAAGVNISDLAQFLGITADPGNDPAGFIKELRGKLQEIDTQLGGGPAEDAIDAGADDASEPGGGMTTPTGNRGKQGNGGIDMKALAGLIRTEVSNAVQSAMGPQLDAEKTNLINAIVANERDDNAKTVKVNKLKGKTIQELRELVSFLPVTNIQHIPLDPSGFPIYTGVAGGGQTNNGGNEWADDANDDDFNHPTINYKEEVKNRRKAN